MFIDVSEILNPNSRHLMIFILTVNNKDVIYIDKVLCQLDQFKPMIFEKTKQLYNNIQCHQS